MQRRRPKKGKIRKKALLKHPPKIQTREKGTFGKKSTKKTSPKPKIKVQKVPRKKEKPVQVPQEIIYSEESEEILIPAHKEQEIQEEPMEEAEEKSMDAEQELPDEIGEISIEATEKTDEIPEEKEDEEPIEEEPSEREESSADTDDFQDQKNQVEALLFACGRYIEYSEIAQLTGLDKRKTKKVLEALRKDYSSQKGSLMIFQEDDSWKINVREKYLPLVRKIVSDTELSRGSMETLAVIAWKSPVFQSEIVKIRGNKCYDHIEDLESMGYVTKDRKGRSYILKTTDKFYTYFDIDHKNLQGVLDSAKRPEPKEMQASLEEIEQPKEEKRSIVDAINVKKKTESEEEKLSQQEFLHKIEEKISAVQEKNVQFSEEIPAPRTDELQEASASPQPLDATQVQEVNAKQPAEGTAQPTQEEQKAKKPKSLTKKQLEKKFREELQRVREKMEKKE